MREKDPERHRVRRYQVNAGLQSVASAVTQFLLAAYSLGYGTCWMTGPLVAKPELESAPSIRPPQQDIDPVLGAEAPDRRRGGNRQRPVLLPLRDLGGFPPLRQPADDLLEEVVDRDDTAQLAVLVDDDGQMDPCPLELAEPIPHVPRFGGARGFFC